MITFKSAPCSSACANALKPAFRCAGRYASAVVKEALRLYPPIPMFPRVAAEADVLPSGHRVPAGEVVFMSAYAMGRWDAIWEDPMRFDPMRFAPDREASRHRFAYTPFGAGPRMCMGANFAQVRQSYFTGRAQPSASVRQVVYTDTDACSASF